MRTTTLLLLLQFARQCPRVILQRELIVLVWLSIELKFPPSPFVGFNRTTATRGPNPLLVTPALGSAMLLGRPRMLVLEELKLVVVFRTVLLMEIGMLMLPVMLGLIVTMVLPV